MQVFPEHKYFIVETPRQVRVVCCAPAKLLLAQRSSSETARLPRIAAQVPLRHGRQRHLRRSGAEAGRRLHCSAGAFRGTDPIKSVCEPRQHGITFSPFSPQGSEDAARAAADIVLTTEGTG